MAENNVFKKHAESREAALEALKTDKAEIEEAKAKEEAKAEKEKADAEKAAAAAKAKADKEKADAEKANGGSK